jgi:hypothetical protein
MCTAWLRVPSGASAAHARPGGKARCHLADEAGGRLAVDWKSQLLVCG